MPRRSKSFLRRSRSSRRSPRSMWSPPNTLWQEALSRRSRAATSTCCANSSQTSTWQRSSCSKRYSNWSRRRLSSEPWRLKGSSSSSFSNSSSNNARRNKRQDKESKAEKAKTKQRKTTKERPRWTTAWESPRPKVKLKGSWRRPKRPLQQLRMLPGRLRRPLSRVRRLRGAEHERQGGTTPTNITSWSTKAEQRVFKQPDVDAFLIAETHLKSGAARRVEKAWAKYGYDVFQKEAEQSDKSEKGNTGGVLLAIRQDWCATQLDQPLVQEVGQSAPHLLHRWAAAELRLKHTTVLLVEVYVYTGMGARGENSQILEQLFLLVKTLGKEAVIAGDWQCEPRELAAAVRLARASLRVMAPPVVATCAAGERRVIDYFAVTAGLLSSHKEAEFTPRHSEDVECHEAAPWAPRGAVTVAIDRRPRKVNVYKLKQPKKLPLQCLAGPPAP